MSIITPLRSDASGDGRLGSGEPASRALHPANGRRERGQLEDQARNGRRLVLVPAYVEDDDQGRAHRSRVGVHTGAGGDGSGPGVTMMAFASLGIVGVLASGVGALGGASASVMPAAGLAITVGRAQALLFVVGLVVGLARLAAEDAFHAGVAAVVAGGLAATVGLVDLLVAPRPTGAVALLAAAGLAVSGLKALVEATFQE